MFYNKHCFYFEDMKMQVEIDSQNYAIIEAVMQSFGLNLVQIKPNIVNITTIDSKPFIFEIQSDYLQMLDCKNVFEQLHNEEQNFHTFMRNKMSFDDYLVQRFNPHTIPSIDDPIIRAKFDMKFEFNNIYEFLSFLVKYSNYMKRGETINFLENFKLRLLTHSTT